jgi:aminomethyltransferase
MKKTFLHENHVSLGAKIAPFGGFLMPIQYEGILAEHFYARKTAVVFDTCHMGEFLIQGPNAVTDLEKILSCPVTSMKPGQCRYGFICNENGGVMDDQILYRLGENNFYMVINSSTQDTDYEWVKLNISPETSVDNISKETGKIDLQGPESLSIITRLLNKPVSELKYYHWMYNSYKGAEIIVSRTGYTGEIGFELYLDEQHTISFWNDCLSCGAKPAGLGSRDTLRLEMGYPLYGHELDANRNAAESGFSRAIALDKSFIGSSVVHDESKVTNMLCGIQLDGRRTARNGDRITDSSGKQTGVVTSGSFSPSLGCAIAMGYIAKNRCLIGTRVKVSTGAAELTGAIVDLPFYKNGTARRKLSEFSF